MRTAAVLAAALATLLPAPVRAAGDDWAGKLAGHPLRAADGETVRISELKGEVVVVNFWASWCKPCRKELRVLDGWLDSLADRPARILAVSVDRDERNARRFAEKEALRLPVYVDGPDGLARSLDLPSLPCTIVLDADGRVARVARDGSLESLRALEGTVRALLEEAAG